MNNIFIFNDKYHYFKDYKKEVGGRFQELGNLQFNFLIKNGLKRSDYLIDIGCGALRGGNYFISFLNKSHYFGLELQERLLQMGVKYELGLDKYITKLPNLVISNKFIFDLFNLNESNKFTIGIAQSIFTHLTKDDINLCLKNLYNNTANNFVLYATFHSTNGKSLIREPKKNPLNSGPHNNFFYSYNEVKNFGINNNYNFEYIGNWNHPNKQIIVKYIKL